MGEFIARVPVNLEVFSCIALVLVRDVLGASPVTAQDSVGDAAWQRWIPRHLQG